MNTSTHLIIENFYDWYVTFNNDILDVGSYNENGTFRDIFYTGYVGLDIRKGPNVDVVVKDPYNWIEIPNETFDIVICGNTIEHVEFPWLTFQEIARVLKHGGFFCIIAPAIWEEHKYPVDCYRYYPDGLRALCKWSNLEYIEGYVQESYEKGVDYKKMMPRPFSDCYCIGYKR